MFWIVLSINIGELKLTTKIVIKLELGIVLHVIDVDHGPFLSRLLIYR